MARKYHKKNHPSPSDLQASAAWIRHQFGLKGRTRGALAHVNRCLDITASYTRYFLLAKANLLGYEERWDELLDLLNRLQVDYPSDPEVAYEHAQFHFAHGRWGKALQKIHRVEKLLGQKGFPFLEGVYDEKVECLIALGRITQAEREAKRILRKHPTFSIIRAKLCTLKTGRYRPPEPWA